jgi:DNA anti-recombination protein RmuC
MQPEQLTHIGTMLENIQRNVSVIAEGHVVLNQRLDELALRFDRMDARFDQMEMRFNVRFDRLEARVERLDTKVDGLVGFAVDAQQRLQRIETHLELEPSGNRDVPHRTSTGGPPGRRKKS